jgi:hypothetical protein
MKQRYCFFDVSKFFKRYEKKFLHIHFTQTKVRILLPLLQQVEVLFFQNVS